MSEPNYLLKWDEVGERFYETGISNGVLYPYDKNTQDPTKAYGPGVVWNGLTGVTEKPSGAEPTALYADNIKYLTLMSNEELGLTVEAYTYPDEFAECDGSAAIANGVSVGQQTRNRFGLCYKTLIGNDVDSTDKGYKLHLVYGCLASPSERAYATVNDSPEAQTFSWEVTTNPIEVSGKKPTAIITIDSTKADSTKLKALESKLYGTAAIEAVAADPEHNIEAVDAAPAVDAYLPLPSEIATMFAAG